MVIIGIPTCNRVDVLKMMASSLYQSNLEVPHKIRIYDDSSTEYSVENLRDIFPDADLIHRHEERKGACGNMLHMYLDFLNSDGDYLFNGDSDLIFHKDWLNRSMEFFPKTEGVLSLFNTPNHVPESEDKDFCYKETLGAAGTMFTRNALQQILSPSTPPLGKLE